MMATTRLDRCRYIGGHDAAAIMGRHPYSTAGHVFAKLVNGVQEDIGDRPSVRRGRMLEGALLDEIESTNGVKLHRDVFSLDESTPFIGGTLDAEDREGRELYEVTTALSYTRDKWGPDGSEDAATHKWLQAQYYLGMRPDYRMAHIYCWVVDTDEILHYPCPRRQGAIDDMRERCESFWYEHVLTGKAPTLTDWGEADPTWASSMLEAIYSKESGGAVDPTPELASAASDYVAARDEEKRWKAAKDKQGSILKGALGEASKCKFDGGRVQWTASKLRPSTDWQSVAVALAQKAGIGDDVYQDVVRQQTKPRHSSRALRVYLNRKKDSE
jgi:predicted phage-related endonuclease